MTAKLDTADFGGFSVAYEVKAKPDGTYDVVLFTHRQDETVHAGEWRPQTTPHFIDKASAERYAQYVLKSVGRVTADGMPVPTVT